MSPISATMTAPSTGPMPGSCWTARYPSCPASSSAVTCSSTVISLVSQPVSCRSEATFQEYGWGSGSSSSQAAPQAPKMPRAGHRDAELGQHPVDLVLAAGPQLHQLAALCRGPDYADAGPCG